MSEVNLISISHPNEEYTGCRTAQELIAWCARVSNPTNQNNLETAPKLLDYLIRNNHWSPLEMVHISMEIKTMRDIARQILRHRSFSFQEFSQRYADPTKNIGFGTREARLQDQKNRQNSIETDNEAVLEEWEKAQKEIIDHAFSVYDWAIKNGIAKEQARVVLPEGNTGSVIIMSGTLRSWIHWIQIRTDKGTQKEHRVIAEKAKLIILEQFPAIRGCFETKS